MRRALTSNLAGILSGLVILVSSVAAGQATERLPGAPPWSPATEYAFGKRYDVGDGVPQNFGYAVYWYRCAANDGDPRAQLALAAHYVGGIGTTQDLVLGYAWANIAAADLPKGSPDWERAAAYRRILTVRLAPWQLERAQQLSSAPYPTAIPCDPPWPP
jgi:TPR repeat protein